MTTTNAEIVRGFIEAINNNQFDRVWDYCSRDCVAHVPPWVGVGIRYDPGIDQHIIVHSLVPGGNAARVLQVGDELIRVSDPHRSWETYSELKNGIWGQGIPGTPLSITIKRDGQVLELHLERGFIPAFDNRLSDSLDVWREDKLRNWPDLRSEIKLIFEKDDLVACFAVDSGVYRDFQRAATWAECNIFRIRDGKITEMWGVEDTYMQLTQLGYEIREPHPEHAL